MQKNQNIEIANEGETEIFVFRNKLSKKGPGSRDKLPFYNPAMELNRDISMIIVQWLVNSSKQKIDILDGLAASGIRGIRFVKEITGDFEVTINDWSEESYRLIAKNIEKLKVKNVAAVNKDLNSLLSEKKFNYIDIDPYGSPVYFIDAAMKSIRNNGILACTATDTATLCGVYPKVCLRRYGARAFHSNVMKEIGLRILLGFVCKTAAIYDKGIKPLISYSTDHYFRIYTQVMNGVNRANNSIKNVSTVKSNKLGDSKNIDIGPLWMGKLQDKKVIKEMRTILFEKKLNTKNDVWKLLDVLEEEADAPSFFYTTDDLASSLKESPPRMKTVFETLKKKGYIVYRTHFSQTGFKTNAPVEDIEEIFKR
jgi:tRNA (guanine26-N2/guanine27-N2)-dimethyltransferase